MKSIFNHQRARTVLATLGPLLTSIVMIPGMTTYLPVSEADQIIMPILLFPIIWLTLFFSCYMLSKVRYVVLLLGSIIISHGVLSYLGVTGVLA